MTLATYRHNEFLPKKGDRILERVNGSEVSHPVHHVNASTRYLFLGAIGLVSVDDLHERLRAGTMKVKLAK